MLAAELTPDSVDDAGHVFAPASVDGQTGLQEADGRKDPAPVQPFQARARAAFQEIGMGAAAG
jgi:phosphoribosylanthranilate isomerase